MDSQDASIRSRQGITMKPQFTSYSHNLHTTTSTNNNNNNNNQFASPNLIPTNPPYAFNSLSASFDSAFLNHNQQQLNGSSSGAALDAEQPARRGRGRPRKYSPDAAGLVSSSNSQVAAGGSVGKEIGGEANGEGSQGRRQRGRPPGSGKKQLDALGGVGGSGFTPHVIKILPKEDVVSRVNEFCQEGPRTIVILSAYGAVCNATIQRPGSTDESGTIFCEGYSDILNLTGPFFEMNCNESRGNTFDLIVVLMGSDGKYSGGKVVGKLIAATTIQIILASYISEPKKSNGSIPPDSSSLHMLAFGGQSTSNNVINASIIKTASDSSDDNVASCSHSQHHNSLGPYNNSNNYPSHNMPIYQQHMSWGNTGLSSGAVHHNNEYK